MYIIVVVVTLLSLWKKGSHDLQEWDESRNGVNAYEMLVNGNYVNLYYNGAPDTWNAKPPLMIWLSAASYKIFGFNEFGLRFPATLATIAFFVLCFYIIFILENATLAFLTCMVLISCKAIFGNHVGLTGDFDCLLLVFLTATVFTFILYVEMGRKNAILWTGLFMGLAFYTKGPASLVLLPGLLLYLVLRKKWEVFRDPKLWLSVIVYLAIAASWLVILSTYGKVSQASFYGSKNSAETMLVYDTFKRMTDPKFDLVKVYDRDHFFFFEVLDARLNLWNYIFYFFIFAGLFAWYKNKTSPVVLVGRNADKMVLLSFCIIVPLAIVLSLAATKNNWYLAPTFMFVAFIVAKGIYAFSKKHKKYAVLAICLFAFTFGRQLYFLYRLPTTFHEYFTGNQELKNKTVILTDPKQDLVLYLTWLGAKHASPEKGLALAENQPVHIFTDKISDFSIKGYKVKLLSTVDSYSLGVIQKQNVSSP